MKRERARATGRRARRRLAGVAGAVAGAIALPASASAVTFEVTTNADSGPGSLRQAINTANTTTPQDTIEFAPSVTSPITLTGGRIPITRSLVIDGPGASALKVVAPSDDAFFVNDTLPSGIVVDIEGLTMEGHSSGPGSGGGAVVIGSGQRTTIRNCVITGSSAANQGGGIFVEDTALEVTGTTISGNTAGSSGGGIYARDAAVTMSGTSLTGNQANTGGGIAMAETGDTHQSRLGIAASTIAGNHATPGDGGGLAIESADGPTVIARTTVSGNGAGGAGGGLYFGYASSLAIDSSTFSTNSAGTGGGIEVFAPSGATTISDSTVANNVSLGKGGGIYSFGYFDKPVTIGNSTIASNVASAGGGGIFRFGYDGTGPGYEGPDEIALASTLVANNLAPSGTDVADGPNADESFRAANSIVGSTSGAAVTESAPGTNQLNTGLVLLAPLADNGGPTRTMLPAADGPAIDAGAANGLASDQRGLPRTVQQPGGTAGSDGTDVGAVELADSTVDGAALKAKRKQRQKGRKVVVKVKATAAEDAEVTASGTVKAGKAKLKMAGPGAHLTAGGTITLKLRPKGKRASRKVARTLARGKKARASVSVQFTDGAGNHDTETGKVTLVD